jgi:hypothetical protein
MKIKYVVGHYTHVVFWQLKGNLSLCLTCLTTKALRHEDIWGNGYIDPRFLDLGTSWR